MAWIHERALGKAERRLGMLGGPDDPGAGARRGKAQGEAIGGAVGAAIANARKKPKQSGEQALIASAGNADQLPQYKQQSEGSYQDLFKQKGDYDFKQDPEGVYGGVDVISGGRPNGNYDFQNDPENVYATAQRNAEVNAAAANAPVGGSYTKAGQEKANKEAEPISNDINMSKQLIRYGGMLQTQVPTFGSGGINPSGGRY